MTSQTPGILRFGSVCSGIEAASVAWGPLGWKAAWLSEIEPFPCAVLAHHYPNVPNLGDMTKFESWPNGPIDLLCGGTPCQSFSVAGLRKGLDDPRGNLMLTYGAIAAKHRPKWLVWENVAGVLSSNGGRDFGTFLGMLGQLGYGFAYRVLDAQYFGVAQRRRRVFVVGCFGDWRSAAAVLFERHSMSGHSAPSRKTRQVAPTIPARSTGGGGLGTDFDLDDGLVPAFTGTLTASAYQDGAGGRPEGAAQGHFIQHAEVMPTMRAGGTSSSKSHGAVSGDTKDEYIVPTVVFHPTQDPIVSNDGTTHALGCGSSGGQASIAVSVCTTLRAGGNKTGGDRPPGTDVDTADSLITVHSPIAKSEKLTATGEGGRHDGVFCVSLRGREGSATAELGDEVQNCLRASSGGGDKPHVLTKMHVRRLTPVECERLQGFPDGYTAIPWRKKTAAECPDGPRYKALGNSWAVPVARWIGQRIQILENQIVQRGSQ